MATRQRVFLRRRIAVLVVVGGLLAVVVVSALAATHDPGSSRHAADTTTTSFARTRGSAAVSSSTGYLAPGSDPSVLPGSVLIADRSNDRLVQVSPTGKVVWQFPRPGDLAPGQTFKVPDDAFFTPDGTQVVATEEDDFVVSLIDIARHRIVWRYGMPGVSGADANQLANPDDAVMLQDGTVLTADIKNCRVALLRPGSNVPIRVWGKPYHCHHLAEPMRFASPNGAFPLPNGHFLVTEITHNWVSEVDLMANPPKIVWDTHPFGVHYPSDSNEVRPGVFITVDFWQPGIVEEFDATGKVLWFYKPLGADALNHPSLAETLPNGDVILTDDDNDRVIVVDPKTNTVVWQYGHRSTPGTNPGFLNDPDGLDLAPPYSLAARTFHG